MMNVSETTLLYQNIIQSLHAISGPFIKTARALSWPDDEFHKTLGLEWRERVFTLCRNKVQTKTTVQRAFQLAHDSSRARQMPMDR